MARAYVEKSVVEYADEVVEGRWRSELLLIVTSVCKTRVAVTGSNPEDLCLRAVHSVG